MPILETIELKSLSSKEKLHIIRRSSIKLESILDNVIHPLYKEVCESPLNAIKKYNQKWDGFVADPILLTREDLEKDHAELKKEQPEVLDAFEKAYQNIHEFHSRQKPHGFETNIKGITLGFKFQPFDSVALYVPGGKALYPSTVLMGSIPASIAGVKNITVITPPDPKNKIVSKVVRAISYMGGVDYLLQSGGAQSILAMLTGIEELNLDQVDFVYGPGNKYVAAAKLFASSRNLCGIDSFAGPSEVIIIADEKANPRYLAHDLLAQAEHDEDAVSILLCTSEEIAVKTAEELENAIQNRDSDRKEVTMKAIQKNGHIFLVDSLEEAVSFSNDFAPEHLEIQVQNDEEILSKINCAGSIFLGEYSPVALGDYYSGTNHILPTNRAARFSSGVSVHSFYRRITYQKCSKEGLQNAKEFISIMSQVEGLFDEHGYSVLTRFES